jgi:hypothetical protein
VGDAGYRFAAHWAFVAIGVAIVIVACYTAWRCARAGSWPTVPGEILQSGLDDHTVDDSDGTTTTRYKPRLRYRYAVKGKTYMGDRVSFGYEWHGVQWTAQRVADRYPVGKRVRVRVSPADPTETSLESGVTFATICAFAGGIAIIALPFLWK